MLEQMNPDGLVIDASIGPILPEGVQYAINSGLKVYRLDMRAGLSGEIIAAVETKELIEIIAGRGGLISEELERYEESIKGSDQELQRGCWWE